MARALVLNHDGEVSELPLTRVDRGKLYGVKRRVVTDENGRPCSSAFLSTDGSTLVPSGGFTMVYLDESGSAVPRGDLITVDENGDELDKLPSTLGLEHELFGPVDPTRVLDHVTTGVYQLDDEKIGPKLAQRLDAGEIFEAEFRYAVSPTTNTIFLLRNEHGTFGLISQALDLTFVYQDTPAEDDDDDDFDESDLDDDLDFNF